VGLAAGLGSRSGANGQTLVVMRRQDLVFKYRVSDKPSTISREQRDADMPVKDELLTVNEAAAYLTIKPWTLRHWISDRKIDIVKYGNGIVRVRRSVLDRYVASCTLKARVSHERNTKEPPLPEGAGVEPGAESLAR
jgi:excisionase family DNA binding protein